MRNSEEVIKGVNLTALLKGLVRSVGGSLWWRGGKLDGHMSTGDDMRRSCVRAGKVPGAGDSAGVGEGLRGNGGGNDLDGRHFVGLKGASGGEEGSRVSQ